MTSENFTRFYLDSLDFLNKMWIDRSDGTFGLTSHFVSFVQPCVISSVFIKVECMQEKVIHKDSTRCIVESLRAGINRRKSTNVSNTTQLKLYHSKFIMVMLVYYVDVSMKDMRLKLALLVKSSGMISSEENQQLIRIWLRLYSDCCCMTKNGRGILACLKLFAKVAAETGGT